MNLAELLERVEKAAGPDRELDYEIARAFGLRAANDADEAERQIKADPKEIERFKDAATIRRISLNTFVRRYTKSLEAIVELGEMELPGWWWKVGTCCVSDDACVAPDYNSPEHGERLHREFPLDIYRKLDERFNSGFDIDRRPSGNVALALCEAVITAKIAILKAKIAEDADKQKLPGQP